MSEMEDKGHIRVVLADDHTMFRQGLREMLSNGEGIEVVGEAENGREAVALVREQKPDLAILDVEMPVMGAAEAMERILTLPTPPKVLIVTMHDNPRLVRELLARGATGYVLKSASLEELVAAVRAATVKDSSSAHGKDFIVAVPRGTLERGEERREGEPSERELEIMLLAARGLSNRQIASRVHLAEATVKRHLANLYAKMEVSSRGEATRKALSEAWFTTQQLTEEEGEPEASVSPPQ